MADNIAEVGDSLGIVSDMNIIVGEGIVPLFPGLPGDGVALRIADNVLSVITVAILYIALCQPRLRAHADGGLGLIETAHIRESGGRTVEVALMELRAPHEHPYFPKEGVVFPAREPFAVAWRLRTVVVPFRLPLDAVKVDGFLGFGDGNVEVRLAQFSACLVANGIERDYFGEVILVAGLLLQRSFYIGLRTIVVDIVTGVESLPPARTGCILRAGAPHGHSYNQDRQ